MQLARSGSDFDERIKKSKLNLRWEMPQRIEAKIKSIGTLVEEGMTQRSKANEEIKKEIRD